MRRRVLALLLVPAALLLTACGGAPPSAASSTAPTTTKATPAPMVGWARQFCGLDSELARILPQAPHDADRQHLLDYLQQAKTLLTAAQQAFAALNPAPSADATAMLTSYRQNIDQGLEDVNGDITETTQAGLADLEVDSTLDQAALTALQASALSVVSSAVKAHPDLKLAFTGVPGCEVYTMGN